MFLSIFDVVIALILAHVGLFVRAQESKHLALVGKQLSHFKMYLITACLI